MGEIVENIVKIQSREIVGTAGTIEKILEVMRKGKVELGSERTTK